ncbi:MAG: sulfatase, partial [Deltaproteobacteria bacterium]|nr:sulfatase [Deltaproteobacteria bacterium]
TEPSHLAMFTGLAPYKSGIVSNGTDLGEREALVWRALGERGYLTGGFVAGFPLHSKYGWAQGMDAWDDDFGAWPGAESLSIVKLYNQFFVKEHALRERPAHRVIDRAARWLRTHREETFFAFVHFYDAHGPYEAPVRPGAVVADPPTSGAILSLPAYWPARHRAITSVDYLKRAYDDEVAYVDGAVGTLLDALGDRLDNTIVVVTADHGESLDEHGYLFDHGDDLYDPSLRVPLVVRYPAAVVAGLVQDCQVSGVDLAPTILDLVAIDDGHARDGVSRVPELRGEPCRDTPVVASTTAGRFVANPPVDHALRGAGTKLIAKESGAVEYYELATDPGELRNLAPGEASKAREELLRLLLRDRATTVGPEMDDATRQALEALGYVEGG